MPGFGIRVMLSCARLVYGGEKVTVAASLRRNPALHDIQSTFWIEGDLQDIPDHWINQMAASYYKLPSIALH